MATSTWKTAEDIRRDLFEYSDLEYPGNSFAPAPPKSIAEYRSRTSQVKNPGLFDDTVQDEIAVFVSGRGKYRQDIIIRPGKPVESVPEDDLILKKKIREVSGLGYRNEIIERVYGRKGSDSESEKEESTLVSDEIKLHPTGSELSSKNNSPRLSPIITSSEEKSSIGSESIEDYEPDDNQVVNNCSPNIFKRSTVYPTDSVGFTNWRDECISPNNNCTVDKPITNWRTNHVPRMNRDDFPPLK